MKKKKQKTKNKKNTYTVPDEWRPLEHVTKFGEKKKRDKKQKRDLENCRKQGGRLQSESS